MPRGSEKGTPLHNTKTKKWFLFERIDYTYSILDLTANDVNCVSKN